MYFDVTKNDNSPIICNVPHSDTSVPEEFKGDFLLSPEALNHEVLYMADNYTNLLYGELLYVSSSIISKISRVVLDIERFENEEDELMSKVGMSALYTRTSSGSPLRTLGVENAEKLRRIYKDYHDSFTELTRNTLINHGMALIVDCHSFPSIPRQYEPEQESNRPDICIGVDAYHTPEVLVDALRKSFEEVGYSVEINTPFAGSIVPTLFYKQDKRVVSVMIEVNRKLYMDEETFEKSKNFSQVSKTISRCVIVMLNHYKENLTK